MGLGPSFTVGGKARGGWAAELWEVGPLWPRIQAPELEGGQVWATLGADARSGLLGPGFWNLLGPLESLEMVMR